MDFTKCVEILSQRDDPYSSRKEFVQNTATPSSPREPINLPEELTEESSLNLVNLFTTLQGERVQVYSDFAESLQALILSRDITNYPQLVAETTTVFSTISRKVIAIKEVLIERSENECARIIAGVQLLEKEKLTLNAAKHLDTIRENYPEFETHFGAQISDAAQQSYVTEKIVTIEQQISELMEEMQCFKCELI